MSDQTTRLPDVPGILEVKVNYGTGGEGTRLASYRAARVATAIRNGKELHSEWAEEDNTHIQVSDLTEESRTQLLELFPVE